MLHKRDDYIAALAEFIEAAPSSYHAVARAREELLAAGFNELDESAQWPQLRAGAASFTVRDGALIAWRAGQKLHPASPLRIFGAHTDSPGFTLKPQPDFTSAGWAQAGVEIYGSPLLHTWLDRDLGLAGRIATGAGKEHLVSTPAVARIPQLAIHLDRESNAALSLDRQRHTQPILAVDAPEISVAEILARAAGVSAADIAGYDVRLYDSQKPALIGVNSDLFAASRLDNLSSTFAGLAALIAAEIAPDSVAMFAAFDHEELGSETRSGAAGPFLADVLDRLRNGQGASAEDAARRLARSWCLSADAGHSVHPNYPEKHDPHAQPVAGRGPMLKVNANQRYASDAHGAALWRRLCAASGVDQQVFVSNNSVACGTTIGPLTATRIGIRTVDVGVPLLSMHSARELAHAADLHALAKVAAQFFGDA